MAVRIPKRTYTQAALEFWYECLCGDWEQYFNLEVLHRAREFYRKGDICELELSVGDAIVRSKVGKRDFYSLLEWVDRRPSVRTSSNNRTLGESLAAAGLYEIEELVADEIAALPHDEREEDKKKEMFPNRSSLESDHPNETGKLLRRLRLDFTVCPQGLVFKAVWIGDDGGGIAARVPVVREGENDSLPNREKLIQLMMMSRRAGFEYKSHDRTFLLRGIERIQSFIANDFEDWKRSCSIQADKSVLSLCDGLKQVRIEAEAVAGKGGLSLKWNFKIGRRELNEKEYGYLLRQSGRRMIVPDLGIIEVDKEQVPVLEKWRLLVGVDGVGKIPRYMLFSLFGQADVPLHLSPELKRWRQGLLGKKSLRVAHPKVLRPYQRLGLEWLIRICESECHGLLADEMGLGKTIQIASLLSVRPLDGRNNLIVCPASVLPVWQSEIGRHFPHLRVEIFKSNHSFDNISGTAIWLSSYTQLRRQRSILDRWEFGYAILDEGQFIKNPDAKVTTACLSIRAEHRFVLTGTPLENTTLDLWTIFRFLMPGFLGHRGQFESILEKEPKELTALLKQQISPFVLRRTKREVAKELRPKVEMELICPMSDLQQREYKRLTEEGVGRFGEDLEATFRTSGTSLFTLLTRLRQVCCDPDLLPWQNAEISQSGKVSFLLNKVEEAVSGNHKIVIFSQFVSLLKRVRKGLRQRVPHVNVFELTGRTVDREVPVREFQNIEGPSVILVSLRAGGTGVTLHSAEYVFLLDPWWNPAVEEQAIDRVHRIGQDKTVFVYRMVTQGTIEERVQRLKEYKKEIFEDVLGSLSDVSNLRQHFRSLSELIAFLPGEDKRKLNQESMGT
ncbi:MAG: RNA polymerase-associated protein RapA [Candidatus Moanabacter tarae]|uniref:RNA polymerase-associated protein RapA n=1 Tax=Candidatus Moanibacter tarae TaxID=2200854 RepID=A0A2Z4AGK1_9BACT|nr:MAG: RNA polymerase-associated protein RapA [Candidatus Moanabacter tarae]|tara:strand:- start:5095 stop:7626 length:2532 start_codon:yes stop_codon:yes gene_type:complete